MKSTIVLTALLISTAAYARPHPAEGGGAPAFEANKTFGLGVELGEPTGLTGKWFYSSNKAIDFGIGDIYDYYDYRGLYLYGDHLWHPVNLATTSSFELPFYVGVGAALWRWDDYRYAPGIDYQGTSMGVRVPLGIDFDFNNSPLDIYVQIVPSAYLFFDTPMGYDHTGYIIVDGSAGIRYWFK